MNNASTHDLRVGVIGLGFAGTTHLDAYTQLPGVTVVALAGQEDARLHELGRTRGVPSLYHDWEDLVSRDDLDIVSIGVPNNLHHPIAIAALTSGKHVFCEKPLATSGALAQQMADAARRNDRVLEVAFNHRRRADVHFLKNYVDSGALGRVYHARASWRRNRGIPGPGSWFTNLETAGGGAMIDLGPHMLDIALHLLGEPSVAAVSAVTYDEVGRSGHGGSLNSKTTGGTQTFEVEDFGSALLRLEGGASIQLEAIWANWSGDDNDLSVDLLGSAGGAQLYDRKRNLPADNTLRLYSELAGTTAVTVPDVHVAGGEHLLVIEEFLATVRSGRWADAHGDQAVARSLILDAIYESARTGTQVAL